MRGTYKVHNTAWTRGGKEERALTQTGKAMIEVTVKTICLLQISTLPFTVGELLYSSCFTCVSVTHTHTHTHAHTCTRTHSLITLTIRGRHVHTYKAKQL